MLFFSLLYVYLMIQLFSFQQPPKTTKMKIPTLSILSVFALLGMALAMGGYGYGSYGASYMPVPVHYGSGYGQTGLDEGGLCKYKCHSECLPLELKALEGYFHVFTLYCELTLCILSD